MTPEEILKKVDAVQEQLDNLRDIYNPHSTKDPAKWNIGGILHIIKRETAELYGQYFWDVKDARPKSKYWHTIEQKKRNSALNASRAERTVWDKGAEK